LINDYKNLVRATYLALSVPPALRDDHPLASGRRELVSPNEMPPCTSQACTTFPATEPDTVFITPPVLTVECKLTSRQSL
jgi:hypothetical protein